MKYKLTNEESDNLKGREKFMEYIKDLVQRDIAVYLSQVVYKRLGLSNDTQTEVSDDRTEVTVNQIIKPTKEEVRQVIKK